MQIQLKRSWIFVVVGCQLEPFFHVDAIDSDSLHHVAPALLSSPRRAHVWAEVARATATFV